ncbi:MAG TPA: universal stress protein [Candidatus Limnocylindria bacterium]|nr:universal stress protein [Candidatus Limnocylindria bacterium]
MIAPSAPGLDPGAAAYDAQPATSVRRILLATDLSPASEGATREALDLARDLRAQLLIVSVIDPTARSIPGGRVERIDQQRAARLASAQAVVARGRDEGVAASFLVWEGEPGPSIVDAAASEQVDMIVVGSHGRGAMGRLLIGSVSDYVVRHASCPVLVVRPRPKA